MTTDETPEMRPNVISKVAFECLVTVVMFVLQIVETLAVLSVGRFVGFRVESGWIGGLIVLNMVLARVIVDGMLRRFGRSRSGKTFEVQGRTIAFAEAEGEVADDEGVEVWCPRSLITGLGLMCLGASLLIAVILVSIPSARNDSVGWAYSLIVFFGLGAGYCFYERRWGKPQAWADRSGVWGLPVGFHLNARFVPWASVATCQIETYFDTFGKSVIARPTLRGNDGKDLMTLNLLYTRCEDQERLMKYIKARLPKPKIVLL